ncbi:hypothetical protein NECAME_15380 [Necator americanus]|uniref:Uncharacterized protein n=1 Tax=Necator americanus TaxID=51031 RepID=W2SID4_NECAM|nr:hypothetical protein NECAME_15380 [Necator americanus]ETN69335.1 hypothetical protein NECAME_15380 [Necator americanus]
MAPEIAIRLSLGALFLPVKNEMEQSQPRKMEERVLFMVDSVEIDRKWAIVNRCGKIRSKDFKILLIYKGEICTSSVD